MVKVDRHNKNIHDISMDRKVYASLNVLTRGFIRAQQKHKNLLELIPDDALIVAMDLGKKQHSVWMSDIEKKPLYYLKVKNSFEGMTRLCQTAQQIQRENGFGHLVFGMEPTAHFWYHVTNYLERYGFRYVLVHTTSVSRERESTYFRPLKSDYRDAQIIAHLCADRKVTFTQLPSDSLWADLKSAAKEYILLIQLLTRERLRLQAFVERLYPNYKDVFSDLTGVTAMSCFSSMAEALELSYQDFEMTLCSRHKHRRLHKPLIWEFYQMVRYSDSDWGAPVFQEALCMPIAHAIERHHLLQSQIETCEQRLLHLYEKTGYAAYLNTIPHLRPVIHAVVLGLLGDPVFYDRSRCLTRFAGMDIKENQSGRYQGETPISHRGNPLLRYIAYVAGFVIKTHDPVFAQRYRDLTHRRKRPLKKNQAIVAPGCKYLRIVWTLCHEKTVYDREKALYGTQVKTSTKPKADSVVEVEA